MRKLSIIVLSALLLCFGGQIGYAQENAALTNQDMPQANVTANTVAPDVSNNTVVPAANQQAAVPAAKEEVKPVVPVSGTADSVQWFWGQVVSVDAANNQFVLNYLDYEGDTEKQVTINVDGGTKFANIQSLADLKPQDAVSIDYIAAADGKIIAKNISLEKPEDTAAAVSQNATATNNSTP